MFKKRAAPTKAVNLNQELTEIVSIPPAEKADHPLLKKQSSRIDHIVQSEPTQSNDSDRIKSPCVNNMFSQPMEVQQPTTNYLQTLKQVNLLEQAPKTMAQQDQLQVIQQQQSHEQQSQPSVKMVQQRNNQQDSNRKQQTDRLIVIEEDENNLQVINDIDGAAGSEQQQYVEQIIKRTLTKSNYSKLNRQSSTNTQESKERSLLNRITVSSVLARIRKDQQAKKESLSRVNGSISHFNTQIDHHKKQLQSQKASYQTNKQKLDEVKSVLEFLYHHGDKVKQFSVPSIVRQIKEAQQQQQRPDVVIEDDYQ